MVGWRKGEGLSNSDRFYGAFRGSRSREMVIMRRDESSESKSVIDRIIQPFYLDGTFDF